MMEIPATLYFSCWSLTSLACLALGFRFLDEEKSSHVFPTVPMFFFKRFFALSVCNSSAFSLITNREPNKQPRYDYSCITLMVLYYPLRIHLYMGPFLFWPVLLATVFVCSIILWCMGLSRYGYAVEFFVRAMMFVIGDGGFFPMLVVTTATLTIANTSEITLHRRIRRPVLWAWNAYNKKKTVRFAVAMLGSILFQRFVKFTSFHHVLAFLFFAGAWVGCLALLMSPADFGVFDFLLSNVMVGCTVNEFGLRGATWFAYFATIALFFLRRKLEMVEYSKQADVVVIGGPEGSQLLPV